MNNYDIAYKKEGVRLTFIELSKQATFDKCAFTDCAKFTEDELIEYADNICWSDCVNYRLVTDKVLEALWSKREELNIKVEEVLSCGVFTEGFMSKWFPLLREAIKEHEIMIYKINGRDLTDPREQMAIERYMSNNGYIKEISNYSLDWCFKHWMYIHPDIPLNEMSKAKNIIENEKFTKNNPDLAEELSGLLEDVIRHPIYKRRFVKALSKCEQLHDLDTKYKQPMRYIVEDIRNWTSNGLKSAEVIALLQLKEKLANYNTSELLRLVLDVRYGE